MTKSRVRVNLRPLKRLADGIKSLSLQARGPFRIMLAQWSRRYRSFARQRFDRYSKGGGNWQPLAFSTTQRKGRKKRKSKAVATASSLALDSGVLVPAAGLGRRVTLLRETGTLFRVLAPRIGQPGQLEKPIRYGVRVGYGGPAPHPRAKVSVATLAEWHQTGAGRLPKREIIVDPDKRTIDGMARDTVKAMGKAYDGK